MVVPPVPMVLMIKAKAAQSTTRRIAQIDYESYPPHNRRKRVTDGKAPQSSSASQSSKFPIRPQSNQVLQSAITTSTRRNQTLQNPACGPQQNLTLTSNNGGFEPHQLTRRSRRNSHSATSATTASRGSEWRLLAGRCLLNVLRYTKANTGGVK